LCNAESLSLDMAVTSYFCVEGQVHVFSGDVCGACDGMCGWQLGTFVLLGLGGLGLLRKGRVNSGWFFERRLRGGYY